MQHSGLSSATAEFDADRLSLWELVCRSACAGSRDTAGPCGRTGQCEACDKCRAGISSSLLQYLHKNVLHHLVAVVVHAYVTGEGLAEENISV